jgi:hypothetical protein
MAAETPSPFRTFEIDRENERAVALLRLAGAAVVLAGSAWLVAVHPTPRAAIAAALGALISLAWIASFARSRARRARKVVLRLDRRGLELEDGEARAEVPWSDVRAIEVDEDRLVVAITRASEPSPMIIEPIWRDTSVYALADALRAARAAASIVAPERDEPPDLSGR